MELTTPTNDEIDKVVSKTSVDKDLIAKMLDVEELPRIERSGNATLIDKTTGEKFELVCDFSLRQQEMLLAGGLLKYTKG